MVVSPHEFIKVKIVGKNKEVWALPVTRSKRGEPEYVKLRYTGPLDLPKLYENFAELLDELRWVATKGGKYYEIYYYQYNSREGWKRYDIWWEVEKGFTPPAGSAPVGEFMYLLRIRWMVPVWYPDRKFGKMEIWFDVAGYYNNIQCMEYRY